MGTTMRPRYCARKEAPVLAPQLAGSHDMMARRMHSHCRACVSCTRLDCMLLTPQTRLCALQAECFQGYPTAMAERPTYQDLGDAASVRGITWRFARRCVSPRDPQTRLAVVEQRCAMQSVAVQVGGAWHAHLVKEDSRASEIMFPAGVLLPFTTVDASEGPDLPACAYSGSNAHVNMSTFTFRVLGVRIFQTTYHLDGPC